MYRGIKRGFTGGKVTIRSQLIEGDGSREGAGIITGGKKPLRAQLIEGRGSTKGWYGGGA
jgi:hypothetical protein